MRFFWLYVIPVGGAKILQWNQAHKQCKNTNGTTPDYLDLFPQVVSGLLFPLLLP